MKTWKPRARRREIITAIHYPHRRRRSVGRKLAKVFLPRANGGGCIYHVTKSH